ncbi:MAG: hypothetical protein K9K86_09535 [Pseudomonadales bacterium]|nr:hypothetical protein [Pseudomonadales bacterium]
MKRFFKKSILGTALFCVCLLSGINDGVAASVDIASTPLFLTSTPVQPNIFFLVDDSGSMNWELMRSKEAQLAWSNLRNGSSSRNLGFNFTPSTGAEYLELCAGYNTLAFNPAVNYIPWAGVDNLGNAYADQSITAARINPYDPSSGTTDLTALVSGAPYGYMPWNDSDNNGKYSIGECSDSNAGGVLTITSSNFVPVSSMSAAMQSNFANWYSYYRTREFVAKKAISGIVSASSARVGLGTLHNNMGVNTIISDMTSGNNKSDLLKKISQVYSSGSTPLRGSLKNVGEYFAGNGGIFSGASSPIVSESDGGECQQNFAVVMTDGYWNGSSPNVGNEDGGISDSAFDGGAYADNVSDSLADVAMKYFEEDLSTLNNKVSAGDRNKAQHLVTYTVAFGVNGNLTQNPIDESVPFNDPLNGAGWPLPNDGIGNATDPYELKADTLTTIDDLRHAAYNGRGLFLNAGSPDSLINSLGVTFSSIEERISSAASVATNSTTLNDGTVIYQARFSSEDWSGELRVLPISLGPNDPNTKCNLPLGAACENNPAWDTKSPSSLFASQAPTNRVILTYNPTSSATGKGIPFRWPSNINALSDTTLSQEQVNALLAGTPIASQQAYGDYLVDYLRGDDVNEGGGNVAGVNFRKRSTKLGDIINSAPIFMGAPNFPYPDQANGADFETVKYSTYKVAKANRASVVYVGANDGMLHGFAASGTSKGKELIAYVPSFVYQNLPELAAPNYSHRYFVDGTPSVGDAFFSGAWHTMLVSGANAGGQGIFALDVTNPQNFTEANANLLVAWEFGDTNTNGSVNDGDPGATGDPDLGFTYSRPDIIKMNNGQWVAVFGNGYNNTLADSSASTTGNAALYVVNIKTGALIKKISVPTAADSATNPNGLATVTPVDADKDFDVDYIYAGDLRGNLWKFDVSNNQADKWDVAFHSGSGKNAVPKPLFTAVSPQGNPQPITARPSVSFQIDKGEDGFLVYFGTGKYLGASDNTATGQETQTFYGIWDNGVAVASRSELLKQEITLEPQVTVGSDKLTLRLTTDNTIDWKVQKGWYLDLINTDPNVTADNRGERQITNPVFRDGRIIFTTLLPSSSSCDYGGSSFLMELDAESGSRLPDPPFDLDNDGDFDDSDSYVVKDASGNIIAVIPPSGLRYDGIISTPTIIGCKGNECKQMSNTSGNVNSVFENTQGGVGRQSWRQLFK